MEAYLSQIIITPYGFAPKGWAFCNGSTLKISTNTALFSLLGTSFGGDGKTTFMLPDLRNRSAIGVGQSSGLSPHYLGEVVGSETTTIIAANLPAHTHTINVTTEPGTTESPEGAYLAHSGQFDKEYKTTATNLVQMNSSMIDAGTGGAPVSVMQPYLVLDYCICLIGVFPSRG